MGAVLALTLALAVFHLNSFLEPDFLNIVNGTCPTRPQWCDAALIEDFWQLVLL